MRKCLITMLAFLSFSTATALADGSTQIIARKACMKASASALNAMAPMFKNEKPFDTKIVTDALDRTKLSCSTWNDFWPADSQNYPGLETRSKATVWSDASGFQLATDTYLKSLETLGASKDEASFKVNFAAVGQSCSTCHQTYRSAE